MPASSSNEDASPESRHARLIEQALADYHRSDFPAAAKIYRAILRENPKHPDALHLLGLIAAQQGHRPRAEKLFRAAIRVSQGSIPNFHNSLGNVLRETNQLNAARESYETALKLDAHFTDAWMNLSRLDQEQATDKSAATQAVLQRAAGVHPTEPRLLRELAGCLLHQNKFTEAIPILDRLLRLAPTDAPAWCQLATAFDATRQRGNAIASLIQAIRHDENNASARLMLGQLMNEISAPHEAEAMLLSAIESGAAGVDAYGTLGNVYKSLGYVDLALDCYAKALAARPSIPDSQNFLYTLLYDPMQDRQEVADEHKLWAEQYAAPHYPTNSNFANNRTPTRPLRIGYVSGHFWDHAVAMFSYPMIAGHDRSQFELFFYTAGVEKDDFTEKFSSLARGWRDISTTDDDTAAQMIRDDQIDILVDLAGHIGGNRLMLFARKPAPIQITYLGYQATTGMGVMDYRLTDSIADPPGQTDSYYVEKLLRLEQFFVYRPSDYAPPVSPLPAETNGFITFGCLNTPTKTGDQVVALWSNILHSVPDSKLILLAPSGLDADPRVEKLFAQHNIPKERLAFIGKRSRRAYLDVFAHIDIALDPFPFSGHTTTCDALWQGVPVITLAGQTYAASMSTATLHHANLKDCITNSPDAYAARTIQLATNLPTLANQRRTMRDHLRAAPILDAQRFTTVLESAYREIWQRWCESPV